MNEKHKEETVKVHYMVVSRLSVSGYLAKGWGPAVDMQWMVSGQAVVRQWMVSVLVNLQDISKYSMGQISNTIL